MNPVLRYTLQVFFVTAAVVISYLLSCTMGSTYDPLQLWLSGAIGLLAGLGFGLRNWLRDRAARRRSRSR